jgi:hypothetical protein
MPTQPRGPAPAGSARTGVRLAGCEGSGGTHDNGEVERPRKVFPFRLLSSIYDITADGPGQILRILRQADMPADAPHPRS